ncbi:hypothetical protein L1D14_10445 [Vibrio tubiashii]|uniref:hypothetical protein n=1 Tax=Vibrio tubiashii TaxID=29498 RepID=UPI001EFCCB25|nr:hypothetical protein [Vibrio tubiashii]MCG9576656.1 hypothetical protein [Vibrio tubiashii]
MLKPWTNISMAVDYLAASTVLADIEKMEELKHDKFIWIHHSDRSTTLIPVQLGYPMSSLETRVTGIDRFYQVENNCCRLITKEYAKHLLDLAPPISVTSESSSEDAFMSITRLINKSPVVRTIGLPEQIDSGNIKNVMIALSRRGKVRILRFINKTLSTVGLIPA